MANDVFLGMDESLPEGKNESTWLQPMVNQWFGLVVSICADIPIVIIPFRVILEFQITLNHQPKPPVNQWLIGYNMGIWMDYNDL